MNRIVSLSLSLASLLPLAVGPVAHAAPAAAGVTLLSAGEALELAFPECELARETLYLEKEEKKRATKLAGKEVETGIVYVYTATRKGELVGYAYFDTHKVRTKRETVMVAIDPDSHVRRIEIVAFAEPKEYMPRAKWYAQFLDKVLDEDLRIKRDIRPVAGATLTANATTDAVRRILALHGVILERPTGAAK